MPSFLQELNSVQRAAATHTTGPVMVIAGPGSGKTRVLTYRIAHLIESGVAAEQILALTFTNKAAREMKERITKVVGERGNGVWAGTFHSIFARILRVEAEKIGFTSQFSIYDSDDSHSILNAIVKEKSLDSKTYNANSLLARISFAKSNIIPPKLYEQNLELMEDDRRNSRPYTHTIYAEYVSRCKKANAMDFDDLLYQLYILWYKNPDNIIEKYRKRFQFVMVDEFQDTNYLQYAIVKRLINYENSPRNICIVGDDAQSIYSFRGATIQNILDFQKDYKDTHVFKLEQNYRSTKHIVEAANHLITYNKDQIQKKIWSDKGEGQKIKILKTSSDNEEAKRVADLIAEQKNRYHLRNRDIAILYRTNAQSRAFEESLNMNRLPYKIFGGLSFYDRKEVKDCIAYLRLAVNFNDEAALRRIINYPKRGIGGTSLEKIEAVANKLQQPLWECLLKANLGQSADTALRQFIALINNFAEKAQQLNAYDAAKFIIQHCKVLDELKNDKTQEGRDRSENVQALLDGIKVFVENDEFVEGQVIHERNLTTYLQNISLQTHWDDQSDNDFITLTSTHQAKGLEYPAVFVVGLEESLFPSFLALQTNDIDEERRLFYVAITRAERFLTLSYATSRYKYGQMRYNEPSRFLNEIAPENLEAAYVPPSSHQLATTAKVTGNFSTPKRHIPIAVITDFKPSPMSLIQAGLRVLHLQFGEGSVILVDGNGENRVATVHFDEVGEKRLVLRFAKLQVLS